MRNCGYCHECGTMLEKVGSDDEWCPGCCEPKYYRSHGWAGMGSAPRECPIDCITFITIGGEKQRVLRRKTDR